MNDNEWDIDKAFVSPYDKFFAGFDANRPLSASQLKEIKTYQRIFALRDKVTAQTDARLLWKEF